MAIISKRSELLRSLRRTTQFKYAVIYVLITAVALIGLNLSTNSTMRQLMYQNKYSSVFGRAQIVASSFTGSEILTRESVGQVMSLLEDVESTRVLITDNEGICLYDNSTRYNAVGSVVLFPEIVSALSGNDVFYSFFQRSVLESHAAIPIMSLNNPIGAVYLMEYDTTQSVLVSALRSNLVSISLVLEALIIVFSVLFSIAVTRRIHKIMSSMAQVQDGDYSHEIDMRGNDELTDLSSEFNKLTRRLQEGEQVRRQFVSDASHELKTPLASIKLLSDSILQNEMPMQTIREFVLDIGNEADRLTRLSQKLLSLSKLDSNVDEAFVVVDAADIAWKVCRMLQPQASLKHITVVPEMQPESYMMNQEDSLYQIIFNLTENAIKYNVEEGSVFLTVKRDEEFVTIEVGDTGVGIPEKEMDHVFDRFYRVDKARSRAMGGSGLGLSIVHDLVEHNDGTISVRAREGGGTVFTVQFAYVHALDEEDLQ